MVNGGCGIQKHNKSSASLSLISAASEWMDDLVATVTRDPVTSREKPLYMYFIIISINVVLIALKYGRCYSILGNANA